MMQRFSPGCAGLIAALLILLIATSVAGQEWFGKGAPGTGGYTPVLTSNQAYMGNPSFAFKIQYGLGGSSGLLGLSLKQRSWYVGNTQILISPWPLELLLLQWVNLGGQKNQPGVGTATVPLPIPGPPNPALAGLDVYAQYIGVDYPTPGNPSASQGLRVELTYPPLVFVGTSVGGSTDPYYLIDPLTRTLKHRGGVAQTDNVTAAAWAYGGKGLFVGSSIRNQVNYADVSSVPPSWRSIYTSAGSGCYGVGYDRVNRRLYTLTDPGTAARELVALDVTDPSSPAFGKRLGNTSGLSVGAALVERWLLSPSGKQAAVLAMVGILGPVNLVLVDTDPMSINYLKSLIVTQVPASGMHLTTRVAFTQDEKLVMVVIQNVGTTPGEIARYDIATNTWLDHNSTQSGIQNIGPNSVPPAMLGSAPTDIEIDPTGAFAVVCGFGGNGWAGRLDLKPGSPSYFSYQTLQPMATLPGAWACGLARDGSLMSIGTFPNANLVLADPLTGTLIGTVGMTGASNVYTAEHR
jgi:hypothetical protein